MNPPARFRRIELLPSAEEGLEGALRDRFNILTKEAPEGLLSKLSDPILKGTQAGIKEAFPGAQPFRVTQAGEAVGQAPTISAATKKVAGFLDKTGIGRPLEALGQFSR